MINDILRQIRNKLQNIAELKYINYDWGQLYHENPPIKYPCCLLNTETLIFNNQGQQVQDAPLNIVLTLADRHAQNPNIRNEDTEVDNKIWDIAEDIHRMLHGFKLEPKDNEYEVGLLTRVQLERVPRNDGIRQVEIKFLCYTTDKTAKPKYKTATARVVVDVK